MLDELKAVAIFIEVVRCGSFRGAARRLGMSPSAVSQNIAQLERQVGNALLFRTTRKLTLTSEGEQLFSNCAEPLDLVATSLEDVCGSPESLKGRLTVSVTTALLHSSLSASIARYCQENPNVELVVHFTDIRHDPVGDQMDLALRAGDMPDSSLRSKLVGHVKRKLVCSSSYGASRGAVDSPAELKEWHWIRLTMMPDERVLKNGQASCTVPTTPGQLSVNSVEAMVQLCTEGMGLATPPDFLVERLIDNGELIEVLPQWQVEPIPVYAVWPGNRVRNRNAHRLVELMTEIC